MKIQLYNFKCWEEKTIDFGNTGIVLLSGKSGIGKTSILDAIIFALFGIGHKLVSIGKKSCKVVFEFNDTKIIRTKGPNRLLVDDKYEDESGQQIINKIFTNNFYLSGYMKQNSYNSFILLSPLEKLSFLEKFAFQDVNLSDYKQKTKGLIKEREEKFISITSQLEMTKNVLKQTEKPGLVEYPIECKNKEKAEKNHHIKIKNNDKKIKHNQKGIELFKEKISATRQLESNIKIQNEEIERVNNRLTELNDYKNSNYDDNNDRLDQMKKQLERFLKLRNDKDLFSNYEKSKEEYDKYYQLEKDKIFKQKNKLEEELWKEESKTEITEQIESHTDFVDGLSMIINNTEKIEGINEKLQQQNSILQKIEEYNMKKKDIEKKLDIRELLKNTYNCPSCEQLLKFENDVLVCCDNNLEDTDITNDKLQHKLEKYQEKINKLQKKQEQFNQYNYQLKILSTEIDDFKQEFELEGDENIDEFKQELEDMKEYLSKNIQKQKELISIQKKIDNFDTSNDILIEMKNKLDKLHDHIKNIDMESLKDIPDINEEQLRNNINLLEQENATISVYLDEINRLQQKKDDYSNKISTMTDSFIEKYKSKKSLEELEKKLSKYDLIVEKLLKEKEDLYNISQQLEKYKYYKKEVDDYNKWLEKEENLTKEEIETKDRLSASKKLKETIKKAESLSILNLIEQINSNVQPYLEIFFEDNPITIQLSPFKNTKKEGKKPQIHVNIEYKGIECDIGMLSGGELQRVVIAFNLALSEMFQLPCLLLDECTSNLDQETTQIIVKGIHDNFSEKNVIMIAHQVVSGIFDKVIEIK